MTIKGIVFDWRGVIIYNPWKNLIKSSAQRLGVSFKYAKAHKMLEEMLQKGLTDSKYLKKICQKLKIENPKIKNFWKKAVQKSFKNQPKTLKLMKKLKEKNYKIGFLSNTEKSAIEFFKKQNYDIDVTVFSCLEGTVKPELKIYEILIKRMQMKPKEIVFLDDKKENILIAQQIGIKRILFKNIKQVKQELKKLGVKW